MRHLLLVLLLLFPVAGCSQNSTEQQGARANEDRTNWRKLSKGMSPDKVRALLGEPLRVETQGEVICWYYQEGQPLERNELDPGIPRSSLLFSARVAGNPELAEWREP